MIDFKEIFGTINEQDGTNPPAICYYPGGFKPPHEGHYEVLRDLVSRTYITKVIVLIGHGERDGITKEMSKQIWDLYLASSPMANVSIQIAKNASPIKDIFGIMNDDLELKAYVAGSTIEIEDGQYADALKKAFGERIMPIAVQEKVVSQGKRLSGTQVRGLVTKLKASVIKLETIADPNSIEYSKAKNEYLNTYETLKGCFPEAVIQKGGYDDILNILDIPILTPDQLQEDKKNGNLVVKVPYEKTTEIENYLNTNLMPFEYSGDVDGNERRMLVPNLGDHGDNSQRDQVIDYLKKAGVEHNIEEVKLDIKPTVTVKDVDKKELKKGIKVEKEHTTDTKTATKIALAHLGEDPKYYTKLSQAGLEENVFSINWWGASLNELSDEKPDVIKDFIDFAVEALELKKTPEVEFSDDEELAKDMHSLGMYNPSNDKLLVVKGSRMTADILRTLAHELVHRKQDELNPLSAEDGKTGSDIENEANAAAGILLRQFGAYRPEIFEKLTEVEEPKKNYKIYCDMDGVIVDFADGYQKLTGKDITGQHMKGDANFWEPITKEGVKFWVTLKWMPDGKQLWDYIKKSNPDLLSAPSREESSRIGKRLWVKRNIPGTKLILRSAERKQEFATPDSILIDDRTDNIERWRNAGGVGILHITAADTIKELQKLGL
jgi:nicotinamide mononucleotide adenylyltransferase